MISEKYCKYYAPSFYDLHPDKKFYSEWCVDGIKKIIFITINKCAGTSLREYLYSKNFDIIDNNFINDDYIVDKINNNFIFYCIIRSPKDRYISGLSEFIHYNKSNCDKEKFIENNLKCNKFIFDEHLLPQNESFYKILEYDKKINFIKMDNNLSEKIHDIFNDGTFIPSLNSYKDKKKSNLIFCKKMYEEYCEENDEFYELYKKDFELYNSIST